VTCQSAQSACTDHDQARTVCALRSTPSTTKLHLQAYIFFIYVAVAIKINLGEGSLHAEQTSVLISHLFYSHFIPQVRLPHVTVQIYCSIAEHILVRLKQSVRSLFRQLACVERVYRQERLTKLTVAQ
jgi:hypothetical protein